MKQDMLQNIVESADIQFNYFSCQIPDLADNPYYQPFIYLLFKNGAIVYVGITYTPKKRMKAHLFTKDFDSCLFMDFGIKSIRLQQNDLLGRKSIRYYLLQTVLEQYFIQVFKTDKIENGNTQTFPIDNIIDAKVFNGVNHRVRDNRIRAWKTY